MRIVTVAGNLTTRPLSSTSLAEIICDRVNAQVPVTKAISVDITGKALLQWYYALPADIRQRFQHLEILNVGESMTMVAELNQLAHKVNTGENQCENNVSRMGDRVVVIISTIMIIIVLAILTYYVLTATAQAAILIRESTAPSAQTETVA